jgi:predicted esterase
LRLIASKPVFLMHDKGDTFVPVAESRRLREAIPPGKIARYSEFDLLAHVVPEASGKGLPLRDSSFPSGHT